MSKLDVSHGLKYGLAAEVGMIFAMILIISVVLLVFNLSKAVIMIAVVVTLFAASYTGGYVSTQICRHGGLVQGLLCGAVLCVIILPASVVSNGYLSGYCILRLIVCVLGGAIGGIKGINTKKTKE